jgi:hypothetical protein
MSFDRDAAEALVRCLGDLADPVDLLAVAANESSLDPAAYNKGGRAAGLWQMTPPAAPGMGWPKDDTQSFTRLSAAAQMPYWRRYFAPHKGQLVSRAACYVCTYLPALLHLAGDPNALLCSIDGRTDDTRHKWTKPQVVSWYMGNLGFDPHVGRPAQRTGEIRVRQLTAAIDRSCAALGTRWTDAVALVNAAKGYQGPEYVAPWVHPPVPMPERDPFGE